MREINNLKSLFSDKSKQNYFFSAFKRYDLKQEEEKFTSHKWNEKIYPSSLSFSMCPYDFIRKEVHLYRRKSLTEINRINLGKALHYFLAQKSMEIPGFLYREPNLPDFLQDRAVRFPEIPVGDLELNLFGYADFIINVNNEPVLVDFKSTTQSEYAFKVWSLPELYLTQLCIYAYFINKNKYYDKPIKKMLCPIWNLSMSLDAPDFQKEESRDFTEELNNRTELLLTHVKNERGRYICNKESSCTYLYCKKHGEKTREDTTIKASDK